MNGDYDINSTYILGELESCQDGMYYATEINYIEHKKDLPSDLSFFSNVQTESTSSTGTTDAETEFSITSDVEAANDEISQSSENKIMKPCCNGLTNI